MIVTPAIVKALFTNFSHIFEQGKTKAEPRWDEVATRITSTSKTQTYGWLGQFPDLKEWVGERVVKDMAASSYTIKNLKFESTIGVERTDIEDDNLGVYAPLVKEMAYKAAIHPDKQVFGLLGRGDREVCYDGQYFFDTDHPLYENADGTGAVSSQSNITQGDGPAWYLMDTRGALKPMIYQERSPAEFTQLTNPNTSDSVFMTDVYKMGVRQRSNVGFGFYQQAHMSRQPLTEDNFNAAFQAMMEMKADGDTPLGVKPTLLVVPPALRAAAQKVILSQLINGGDTNPNYNAVKVEVIEWLS